MDGFEPVDSTNNGHQNSSSDVIIADIGGYSIKYGSPEWEMPKTMGNCICKVKSERRRLYIGDQLDDCKDFSSLFYILPFNKGFLINWDVERQIFDHLFRRNLVIDDFAEKTFLYTEPYFNFRQLQENMLEVMYEEYGFGHLAKTTPAFLSMLNRTKESFRKKCCLVVDSGYSFTHIVPYVEGKVVKGAIRRIDVGGKALTNHLKDIISYRQLHVLDETYVINHCKEDCCYVSTEFFKDMEKSREKKNSITKEYVLPDFTSIKRGYIRPEKDNNSDLQSLRMNNERFQVPEILFHPSDVGINQIGISTTIVYSIELCPEEFRPALYDNIVLIGGNTKFVGYRDRIYQDVRAMVDSLCEVTVEAAENPIEDPYLGGRYLTNNLSDYFREMCFSKKQYEEVGAQNLLAKMEQASLVIDQPTPMEIEP